MRIAGGIAGADKGLTKESDGLTLCLSGNTTVSQGVLSLGYANPNHDDATVTIAQSAAAPQLNYAGTDTVARLVHQ